MADHLFAPVPALPKVSVAIPCRNESGYIGDLLRSLVSADRGGMQLDVFVCDGRSEDDTREEINGFAHAHDFIHLLDNPERTTPHALNIGLQARPFDIGIILGAHATVSPDFFQRSVDALRSDQRAACAGGVIESSYPDDTSRRIGLAMAHPFGVGDATFRTGRREGYVDTVAFGAYRREIFDRVGWFDEELDRNQDDEFNFRVTRAGFRILLDPRIRSRYVVRSSYRRLWKQYEQYGLWKVFVNRKHRTLTTARQLVPALWIGFLALCLIAAPWWPAALAILLTGMAAYVAAGLWSALRVAGFRDVPGTMLAFTILHAAYGIGYWKGLYRTVLLGQRPGRRARTMSR